MNLVIEISSLPAGSTETCTQGRRKKIHLSVCGRPAVYRLKNQLGVARDTFACEECMANFRSQPTAASRNSVVK